MADALSQPTAVARASTRGYGHPSHNSSVRSESAANETMPHLNTDYDTQDNGQGPVAPHYAMPAGQAAVAAQYPAIPTPRTPHMPSPSSSGHHQHSQGSANGHGSSNHTAAPTGPVTAAPAPVTTPGPGGQTAPLIPGSRQKVHKRTSIGPWDFVKSIGAGSMGQVKLAVHRYTRQPAAIKIVAKAAALNPHNSSSGGGESNETKDGRVIREAALGKLMNHPNIAQMYEIYSMTSHYYLVFEYVAGGQLLDYIITHGSVKETQARRIAREVTSALAYCHRHSIVHRDLKIENILITDRGGIKLIDFGLANLFRRDSLLRTFCGSLYFAAPELLNATPYLGPEIDIWSFGVVLYVLVCGKVPFEDKSMSALHAKIKRGVVEYPTWLSPLCIDLLQRMLVVPPSERATMHEVLHHPWINKGYDEIPSAHVPMRAPLEPPLDQAVIQEMASMQFGTESDISRELAAVLQSQPYNEAVARWHMLHPQLSAGISRQSVTTASLLPSPTVPALAGSANTVGGIQNIKLPDPTDSFQPLLSLYVLTRERMVRQGMLNEPLIRSPSLSPSSSIQRLPYNSSTATPNVANPPVQARRVATLPSRTRVPVPMDRETPTPQQQQQATQPKYSTTPARHASQKEPTFASAQQQAQIVTPGSSHVPQFAVVPAPPPRATTRVRSRTHGPFDAPAGSQLYATSRAGGSTGSSGLGIAAPTPATPDPSERRHLSVHTHAATNPGNNTGGSLSPNSASNNNNFSSLLRRLSLRRQRNRSDQTSDLAPSAVPISETGRTPHLQFGAPSTASHYQTATPSPAPIVGRSAIRSNHLRAKSLGQPLGEQDISGSGNIGMPSIEAPKQVSFKGFFSVQSTSTRPLPEIRCEIIRVLEQQGIEYIEIRGGFACIFGASQHLTNSAYLSPAGPATPVVPRIDGSSSLSAHRRNNSRAGSRSGVSGAPSANGQSFGEHGSSSSRNNSAGSSQAGLASPMRDNNDGFSSSQESIDLAVGGSDMLGHIASRTPAPVRFEISIVRVPLLGLHGVQFKKISGNVWEYKSIAQGILERLHL